MRVKAADFIEGHF